jgi:hypothetical protein
MEQINLEAQGLCLNLARYTGYTDCEAFLNFSYPPPPEKSGIVPRLAHHKFPPSHFEIIRQSPHYSTPYIADTVRVRKYT